MSTIINTPPQNNSEEEMGTGLILGIIIAVLVIIILFFVYGWPAMRGNNTPVPQPQQAGTNINVTIPAGSSEQIPEGSESSI